MAQIVHNADLAPAFDGYETCAACGFDVAFYTGNHFAAFSTDSGNTFQKTSPHELMKLYRQHFLLRSTSGVRSKN